VVADSREIAELVEKRHDNVKRTIESLADQGIIVHPQIEDEPEADERGRQRRSPAQN
jgi:phage regulator Rha-like protein